MVTKKCNIGCFLIKLEGATYMQIHEAGGGIHFSVNKTTMANEDNLYKSLQKRLENFVRAGL